MPGELLDVIAEKVGLEKIPMMGTAMFDRMRKLADETTLVLQRRGGMIGAYADVREFHNAMGLPVGSTPTLLSEIRTALRKKLIEEEKDELFAALDAGDLVNIVDGALDLMYVLNGLLVEMGVDAGPLWAEVHRSNMAKAGGPKREDGKQLKPDGWQPPDIAGILARQPPLE